MLQPCRDMGHHWSLRGWGRVLSAGQVDSVQQEHLGAQDTEECSRGSACPPGSALARGTGCEPYDRKHQRFAVSREREKWPLEV